MRVQVHFIQFPVCKYIVLSHCICKTLCHGYTMPHGATLLPHRVHRAACAARLFWNMSQCAAKRANIAVVWLSSQ